MSLRLVIGHATDVGKVRDHNEDGYLIDADLALVAVADGMGGHRGGEVASAIALDALHAAFSETGGLRDAVRAANDAVLERGANEAQLRGMGTTLTAGVLGIDDTLLVGHVGDSRAYLLRDGQLSRITTDHSLVEELIAAGELTEEEAVRDPRRSMITRAIGLEADLDVDLYPVALAPGDRVLLCSDGLTTMLHEDAILSILAGEPDPVKAALKLVAAANAAGGVDNTTVLVLDAVDNGAAGADATSVLDVVGDSALDENAADAERPDGASEAGTARKRRFGIFRRR